MNRIVTLAKKNVPTILIVSGICSFYANVLGFYDFCKKVVGILHRLLQIPESTTTNLLVALIIILIAVGAISLIKEKTTEEKTAIDDQKTRNRYLKFIRQEITANLKHATEHATYLQLQLKNSSHLVFPFCAIYQKKDETEEIKESIEELINEETFRMLLLGAPGAGKTTTLLKCFESSLEKAEADVTAPIPFMISLAKWKKKGHADEEHGMGKNKNASNPNSASNFDDWIIKTVCAIRGSSLKENVVKDWLRKQQLILFFDGLDEIQEHLRGEVLIYINQFLDDYPEIPVMVCSRIMDYEALVEQSHTKLRLSSAAKINPLTDQQIEDYLLAAGQQDLKEFIYADEELKEMARSPLELSIMVTAYHSKRFSEKIKASPNSLTEKRFILFDAYVYAMMHREYNKKQINRFSPDSILIPDKDLLEKKVNKVYRYFSTIANILSINSQNVFSLNRISENYQDHQPGKSKFKTVADIGILIGTFLIFLPFVYKLQPLWIHLFALMITIVSYCSATHYAVNIDEDEKQNNKPKKIKTSTLSSIHLLAYLPAITICLAMFYSILKMFIKQAYLGWYLTAFFVTVYYMILYISTTTINQNMHIRKKYLMPILFSLLSLIPLVTSVLLIEGSYHWLQLVYITIVLTNAMHWTFYPGKTKQNKTSISIIIAANLIGLSIIALINLSNQYVDLFFYFACYMFLALVLFASGFETDREEVFTIFLGTIIVLMITLFTASKWGLVLIMIIGALLYQFCRKQIERLFIYLSSRIIVLYLIILGKLPFRFKKFIRYGKDTLLLKGHTNEFEFIHRKIRDYFAICAYAPGITKLSLDDKEKMIRKISSYRDASCDILLELINDNDKRIRVACIEGLGEIGSVVAATALFKASERTSGDLKSLIVKQIALITDISAVPVIVEYLEKSPLESDIFRAALEALTLKIERLSVWENTRKLKESLYLKSELPFYMVYKIRDELQFRNLEKEDYERLQTKSIYFESVAEEDAYYNIRKQDQDTLISLIAHQNYRLSLEAFNQLAKKDFNLAIEKLIENATDRELDWGSKYHLEDCDKILSCLNEKTFIGNDISLFLGSCKLIQNIDTDAFEDFILHQPETIQLSFNSEIIDLLKQRDIKKSIPFLINSYKYNIQKREVISHLLLKYPNENSQKEYLKYVQENGEDESIVPMVYLSAYFNEVELVAIMKPMLSSENESLKNAAIYIMGLFQVIDTKSILLNQFNLVVLEERNEEDEDLLENLIYALNSLGETSIVSFLPSLFKKHHTLREIISVTLTHFNSKEEIIEVSNIIVNEGESVNNTSIRVTLANHLVYFGETELALEVLFLPGIVEGTIFNKYRDNGLTGIIAGETNYLWQYYDEKKIDEIEPPIDVTTLLNALDTRTRYYNQKRNHFYEYVQIKELDYRLIEFINLYDIELSKTLCYQLIINPELGINDHLNTLFEQELYGKRKALMAVLIQHYGVTEKLADLRTCLKEETDDEIYYPCACAIIALKDKQGIDIIISNLKSSSYQTVKKSIDAIVRFNNSLSIIPNILNLYLEYKIFREVTSLELGGDILKLTYNDLDALMSMSDEHIRYCAASYVPKQDDASLVPSLALLIDDEAKTFVTKTKSNDTVSNAALIALEQIGTNQAFEIIKKRKKL